MTGRCTVLVASTCVVTAGRVSGDICGFVWDGIWAIPSRALARSGSGVLLISRCRARAPGKAWERRMARLTTKLETFHNDPVSLNLTRQSRPAAGTECCGRQEARKAERNVRSVHREQAGRDMSPEIALFVGADAVSAAEGSTPLADGPSGGVPPGCDTRACLRKGSSRNLGDPDVSSIRGTKGVGQRNPSDGRQGVRAPAWYRGSRGTVPRDPVEGRRASEHGTEGGKGGWEHRVPATSLRNFSG
jgi:hypothetical protein